MASELYIVVSDARVDGDFHTYPVAFPDNITYAEVVQIAHQSAIQTGECVDIMRRRAGSEPAWVASVAPVP